MSIEWHQDPMEMIGFAGVYVAGFVGLKLARSGRPPMKLRRVKLVYNTVMSLFSLYIFLGVGRLLLLNYSTAKGEAVLVCDSQNELFAGMERLFQLFYYSKYVEFADTFFLVMAGVAEPSMKMGLHLYHHFVTPSIVYTTWFYPCTGGWIGPLTNSLVHVIMYAYYGLSVVWPGIKKFGNLVTYVQLTQFIGVIVYHVVVVIPNAASCNCNIYQLTYNFSQYIIFLFLFFFFLIVKNRKTGTVKKE